MELSAAWDFMMKEFMDYKILENTGYQWTIAVCLFIILFASIEVIRYFLIKNLKRIAKKTTNDIDDMVVEFIEDIKPMLYFYISLYAASRYLVLPGIADMVLWYMLIILIVYYLVIAVHKMIDYFTKKQIDRRNDDDDTIVIVMSLILKVIISVVAILLILSNLGVNVYSLIAGLGIGGIAIAFALQKILEDIFASFTIYFDKPFQVGDTIQIDQEIGTVKKIGLKTTRLDDIKGEEIIVPNSLLTSTKIHNFRRMEKRYVRFTIGIDYETPAAKLKKTKKIAEEIIRSTKGAEFDRVHFKNYGDYSLVFELAYYIKSVELTKYLDIQEEINIKLKEQLEKEKIRFAYQTAFMKLK